VGGRVRDVEECFILRLLPTGVRTATRTGLPPAGDDELTNRKISYLHSLTSPFH
jgi:hypothetical protein